MWIGSDSWGAKVYPVRDQEFAAEGAITILPFRTSLRGIISDIKNFYIYLHLINEIYREFKKFNIIIKLR